MAVPSSQLFPVSSVAVALAKSSSGSVIVYVSLMLQFLESVTVTV